MVTLLRLLDSGISVNANLKLLKPTTGGRRKRKTRNRNTRRL